MICLYYLNKVKSGTCRLCAACRNQWSVKLQHQTARIIAQKGANVPATFTEHFYNDWIKRKKYRFILYSGFSLSLYHFSDLYFSFRMNVSLVKHDIRFISALKETYHMKASIFLSSFWPFWTIFPLIQSYSESLSTKTRLFSAKSRMAATNFWSLYNARKCTQPDTHYMGGIIETWLCPVRDVPSSVWFVRLYYTQIQLVIRLLLDHSKKPPQIPATHPLTLWLGLKLIFHLTGVTILVVWAFQPSTNSAHAHQENLFSPSECLH